MSLTQKSKQDILQEFPDPKTGTREYRGDDRRHTDARSIREYFGVGAYDGEAFDYQNLIPNVLDLEWNTGPEKIEGGSDLLGVGKPGSGKSTFLNHLSLRAIEVPRAQLVWRASPSRSEWLALAPWAKLCLPAGVDYTIRLEPKRPTDPKVEFDVDELEGIVREVEFYEDVRELNEEVLEQGKIHIVYPDPLMRGLQDAYEASEEKRVDEPKDRDLFSPEDPSKHFWFGWVLDRVENGPHYWTVLNLDEIGDIAPESAGKDQFATLQKIELLKDCWIDARKHGLAIWMFGHTEVDIHNLIRHKVRWRIRMNGVANPTTASGVIGFNKVPMNTDMTSSMPVGKALIFNEQNFEKISWPDYSSPVDHKLKIRTRGGLAA